VVRTHIKEENVFTKSRKILALGLAAAVATTGIAIAGTTGADLNDAKVIGKTTPSKLPKKRFVPVSSLLGVENSPDSTGDEDANAASERIAISKNIKVNLTKAPVCTAALPNGSTTEFARDACPPRSYLGGGDAVVYAPTAACGVGATEPCIAAEPVVSVFNGPGAGQLRLHTYSPNLGPASPVVNARIVRATSQERNKGYGQALTVPNAPVTGALKITEFSSTILKARKVVTARCKVRRIKLLRTVEYTDGSSETATKAEACTVRR
jgi:hypothetical protein